MARTNEAKVRDIMSTSLTSVQVDAFINDASLWVTEELVTAAKANISDDRLELIERYLACALIRVRELGLKSAAIGDVSESYQVDSEVNDYLKRAASFDPTGRLYQAFLSTKKAVRFQVGAGFGDQSLADL